MYVIFKAGDVVMTPHGKGVVIGPDLCNDNMSWPSRPVIIVNTGRFIVKLAEGHSWIIKDCNPAYWPKDLKHI